MTRKDGGLPTDCGYSYLFLFLQRTPTGSHTPPRTGLPNSLYPPLAILCRHTRERHPPHFAGRVGHPAQRPYHEPGRCRAQHSF